MGIITYDDKNFLMDGKPYTIISGAMHYFRVPREYWHDRLLKMKECGFNTVETYTVWNMHEKEEGVYDFSGMLDVAAYVDEAASLGLNVIIRPGPYICSESDFGSLPAWLLKYGDMSIRCADPLFLEKVRRYFHVLFGELCPRLSTNGGNIIMMQIENEYGSYGNDKEYLKAVADIYRECGIDVALFTSDGTCQWMLEGGTLPDVLCIANFGSNPKENFGALERFRPNQPKMCGEFWCGWFDHWYEDHHTRDPEELASCFREMLESGASVNFYMFHGGTNFGFRNGANYGGKYEPTITSYDFNALLTEAGDITPAYHAVRRVLEEFYGKLPPLTGKNSEKAAYGKVELTQECFVLDAAPLMVSPVRAASPKWQESIGQNMGFTLYSTVLRGPCEELELGADAIHDRAAVYIDGEWKGLYERSRRSDKVTVRLGAGESVKLDILVENMGRVNYGPEMRDRKGMVGVRLGQQYQFGWDMFPLTMSPEQLDKIPFRPKEGKDVGSSSFLRGTLEIKDQPKDTFIRLDGFHHGFVVVNGFNLGRYYNDAGPQKTLYCPAPMLKEGTNEIIVFEMDGSDRSEIVFTDTPDLG